MVNELVKDATVGTVIDATGKCLLPGESKINVELNSSFRPLIV